MEEVTKQKVTEFYDRVYESGGEESMRPLQHYREVFEYFKPVKKDGSLLDIGCGTGFFMRVATDAALKVYGVDISPKAVEVSKRTVPEAEILAASGEELPFQNHFFDYILFGGTLEHFLDVDKGLEEAYRVAKSDATFFIIVPNQNYWLWRVRGDYGTNQKEVKELLLTYDGWVELFKKHGIKPVKVFHDPWPWKSVRIFKKKNPWRILRRSIYRLIWLFIPLKQTYQFIFICNKIQGS